MLIIGRLISVVYLGKEVKFEVLVDSELTLGHILPDCIQAFKISKVSLLL